MDLKQIGEFIASCRKEKGFTQEKLAKKLFISEKTISKWECGKGFPEASLILPLCEELSISANELLSGKNLSSEEYKKQAEQNLVAMRKAQEDANKNLLALEWVIGLISTISFMLMIFSASYFIKNLAMRISMIVVSFVLLFVGVCFCMHIERNVGFYQCAKCHHKYVPAYSSFLWSMHVGRTRYLKCPKCGKKSWNKKTIDLD